jgi:hypothetical protein
VADCGGRLGGGEAPLVAGALKTCTGSDA